MSDRLQKTWSLCNSAYVYSVRNLKTTAWTHR